MSLALLTPRQALNKQNKPYVKVKPVQSDIDKFKEEMVRMLDHAKIGEREEYHKTLVRDFLNNTDYAPDYFINTKGNNDWVIHTGKTSETNVGVIIEAKSPSNKSEMVKKDSLNTKAMWELIFYFLDEIITHKNLDLKHLIITNMYEWFIFDAKVFYKYFGANKDLVRIFKDFSADTLYIENKPDFYNKIAKQAVADVETEIEFTYFDIREKEAILRSKTGDNDSKLISLFKLLSPHNLLKKEIPNDSNILNEGFYKELLHIIGLEEVKEGSKKVIRRKNEIGRDEGSLIENTIKKLQSSDKLSRVKRPHIFGSNEEEQYFGIALELVITWINRILFLKLLEAQLVTYHKGNKSYSFLNISQLSSFDDLNSLFLDVLAISPNNRRTDVKNKFKNIPYLNSSLFELTDLEQDCIEINQLEDSLKVKILGTTILTDRSERRKTGEIPCLEYILSFLNSYDFSSVGGEEIQQDRKMLINASVLGLIFEKINGYKDGSFYTPSFITMFMCRETIRRAIIKKFNNIKQWECTSLIDIHNKIDDIKEANDIVNSIKICDPAVGSGHFLVSALNEIISIKSELGILRDREAKLLRGYTVEIVDDELLVTDEEGEQFVYNPKLSESRRIQETLFTEKKILIEKCLFGVDINHNSVKICRLRLWIELLKHAYYTSDSSYTELETLPNIDINIKTGNSLVSRYRLDADINKALKKNNWGVNEYRDAVFNYQNAANKDQKRKMRNIIADIKQDFTYQLTQIDRAKLSAPKYELDLLLNQPRMFEPTKKEEVARKKRQSDLEATVSDIVHKIEEKKNNKIYENAFEWRFEFPEVLGDDGAFIGFDVVVGNPPYINYRDIKSKEEKTYLTENYKIAEYQSDLYILFVELSFILLNGSGEFSFIMPNSITNNLNNSSSRKFILDNSAIRSIINTPIGVFPDATVDTIVLTCSLPYTKMNRLKAYNSNASNFYQIDEISQDDMLANENYYFDFLTDRNVKKILEKIEKTLVSF